MMIKIANDIVCSQFLKELLLPECQCLDARSIHLPSLNAKKTPNKQNSDCLKIPELITFQVQIVIIVLFFFYHILMFVTTAI